MEVGVVQVQPEAVILSAPLAPNINHRGTVFGGSASAVAILAAWSLLHTRLFGEGIASRLVIQRNTMSYEWPKDGTFTAEAAIESAEARERFLRMLKRRGKARITVTSVLNFGGKVAGRFEGEFVALCNRCPINYSTEYCVIKPRSAVGCGEVRTASFAIDVHHCVQRILRAMHNVF
ncbi:YiiD C-terminal domain-containing protein [Methylobacter sp. YRD-M1]|uniref:YiiD C-terminal domain-containing protein n=1 Tax=Methylobacter sp. YRD-M1 TaxID=2911520 RepID=UPI002376F9DB|nr:thioesterase domain-containing protein [Methylobacter sp. YRD-M1]